VDVLDDIERHVGDLRVIVLPRLVLRGGKAQVVDFLDQRHDVERRHAIADEVALLRARVLHDLALHAATGQAHEVHGRGIVIVLDVLVAKVGYHFLGRGEVSLRLRTNVSAHRRRV